MLSRFTKRSIVFVSCALFYAVAIGLTLKYGGGTRHSVPTISASTDQSDPLRKDVCVDEVEASVVEEPIKVSVPKETAEEVWFRHGEKMQEASQKRFAAMEIELQAIAAFLKKVESVGHLEKFADKVTQVDNVWQISTDPVAGRACINREFQNHVLDSRALVNIVEDMLANFDSRLAEIDNELLVECEIDLDYMPLETVKLDISKFHTSVDQSVGDLLPYAQGVWGECLVSGGAGIAVAALAEHLASNSESATDKALSMFAGGVAGWAAEEAIASSGTSRRDLINSASSIRSQVLESLKAEDVPGNFWAQRLFEIVMKHEAGCNLAIAESLGLERSWAIENMPKQRSSK